MICVGRPLISNHNTYAEYHDSFLMEARRTEAERRNNPKHHRPHGRLRRGRAVR